MKKNTDVSERLEQMIDFLGVNRNAFAKSLGYERSQVVYDIINGKAKPSFDFFERLLDSEYSDKINIDWLISEKGSMIKQIDEEIETNYKRSPKVVEKNYDIQSIPLYEISAAAGLKSLFAGGKQNVIDTLRIPNLSKVDGAVFITGDSMYPLLKSGDIVVFKMIHDINYLHLGDIYILAYEINGDEYVVVKYVNESNKEGYVKLVSYNDHFKPMDIPISAISTIALVKASIRYNTMQ
ncbi:transcriptional regulator [Dysgonomonas sp. 216]|uniref:S24 family peptidase n=1 Tax=Dysgonomonas sp. 216 TaxID=2302934 RepID=UPI0013D4150E|nr:S24 family peptidase [Dysgonomonas sp. 216]NDW19717.1 transcriptional regulator [Dysgonomonas sp. 216]